MPLERLLRPNSIAVYGASENRGPGRRILEMLDKMAYGGAVYPINPKYETVLGKRCYRGLEEIPEGIDAIVFCVNHSLVTEPFRVAAARGYGAAGGAGRGGSPNGARKAGGARKRSRPQRAAPAWRYADPTAWAC